MVHPMGDRGHRHVILPHAINVFASAQMPGLGDVVKTCGHLGAPLECVAKVEDKSYAANALQKQIQHIFIVYVGSSISGIGILGSLICLFVFLRYRLAVPTTHYLLVASSLIDLLYLSMEAVVHYPPFIIGNRQGTYLGSYLFLGVLRSGIHFTQLLRNWIIVGIGFERYLIICHPVYFRTQWILKHIHACMAVLVSLCLLIRLPYILAYTFDIWGPEWCHLSGFLTSLHAISDVIFVALIPIPVLATLVTLTIAESNRLQRWRFSITAQSIKNAPKPKNLNRRAHHALMVVALCFTLFTSAFIPNGILRIMQYSGVGAICRIYFYRQVTAGLLFIGGLLNSSTSFFVYLVYWARFRDLVSRSLGGVLPCLKRLPWCVTVSANEILERRCSGFFNSPLIFAPEFSVPMTAAVSEEMRNPAS